MNQRVVSVASLTDKLLRIWLQKEEILITSLGAIHVAR